jgi:hypothetical protein
MARKMYNVPYYESKHSQNVIDSHNYGKRITIDSSEAHKRKPTFLWK